MDQLKEKNFVSVVVYVHNNESEIGTFLEKVHRLINSHFSSFEIICVNDMSEDKSAEVLQSKAKQLKGGIISVVNMSFYQGIESSMNAGVDLSIGDFVFEFDSSDVDFEDAVILQIYERALLGYDIVSASNNKSKLVSRLFYWLYNRNANSQYDLQTETLRVISRRAINRIRSMSDVVPYRKALYAKCGLKTDRILFHSAAKREDTITDAQKKSRNETAIVSLILFTNVANKFSMIMSAVMMLATLAGIIYTLFIYFVGQPIEGYTTIMLVMTGSFFGIFAVLSIILKYLSVLVNLIFKKQKYIIESVTKISD